MNKDENKKKKKRYCRFSEESFRHLYVNPNPGEPLGLEYIPDPMP